MIISAEQRTQISEIMRQHGAANWKLFEDIQHLKFPTAADAHFLIIPGNELDLDQYNQLKIQLKKLFRPSFLEFYTPDDLNGLVDEGKLDSKLRDRILSEQSSEIEDNTVADNNMLVSKSGFFKPGTPLQVISLQSVNGDTFNISLDDLPDETIYQIIQGKLNAKDSLAQSQFSANVTSILQPKDLVIPVPQRIK